MPRRGVRRLQRAIGNARYLRTDGGKAEWIPVLTLLANEGSGHIRHVSTNEEQGNGTSLKQTLLDLQQQFSESRRHYATEAAAEALRLLHEERTPMEAQSFHTALWHHVRAHENRNRPDKQT